VRARPPARARAAALPCRTGAALLLGVPLLDYATSLVQLLCVSVSGLLWAVWQLLQPASDATHSSLPELHQVRVRACEGVWRVWRAGVCGAHRLRVEVGAHASPR
jgi:hypothetical protein